MAIYGAKEKSEILLKMLTGLEKNAGITAVHQGSIARAFADAVSTEIADLYQSMKFSLDQSNLITASGRNLDSIGELYGVPRKSVTTMVADERQSYNIEFSLSTPYSSSIVIPKDTLVYNDVSSFAAKQYSYKLVEDVTILTGSTKAYGRVTPNFSDNSYVAPKNSLTKHNLVYSEPVVIFVTNPKEVYSNINGESDINYRRRIVASLKARSSGTAESVRMAALSVKGVKDVRIREGSYGIGSCDVIVVPESSTYIKSLPTTILGVINSVKPVGIRFNIRIAEKININLGITVTLAAGTAAIASSGLTSQASLFVRRYLNSLTIGDIVSINEIQRQVRASSDLIRGININFMNANGEELPIQDAVFNSVREYPAAGTVAVYSVIMSSSNY